MGCQAIRTPARAPRADEPRPARAPSGTHVRHLGNDGPRRLRVPECRFRLTGARIDCSDLPRCSARRGGTRGSGRGADVSSCAVSAGVFGNDVEDVRGAVAKPSENVMSTDDGVLAEAELANGRSPCMRGERHDLGPWRSKMASGGKSTVRCGEKSSNRGVWISTVGPSSTVTVTPGRSPGQWRPRSRAAPPWSAGRDPRRCSTHSRTRS